MVTAWPARLAVFANEFHSTGAFGVRAASGLFGTRGSDTISPSSRGWPWSAVAGPASAGDDDYLPEPAVEVEVVPLVLAGTAVRHVGVQRVPVPGHLLGAVGPGGRAEGAGDARGVGRSAGHRRPVRRAAGVAVGLARGVRGEPIHGEPLGVGEHGDAADLAGLDRDR